MRKYLRLIGSWLQRLFGPMNPYLPRYPEIAVPWVVTQMELSILECAASRQMVRTLVMSDPPTAWYPPLRDEYTPAEMRMYFNLQEPDDVQVPYWPDVRKVVLCRAANERDTSLCVAVLTPQTEGYHRIPRITMLSQHKSESMGLFVALELIERWEKVTDKTHSPIAILDREQLSDVLRAYRQELS